VTYTCAHAHARAHTHTQTDRQTHVQMLHRCCPSPTRTLSLCCCRSRRGRPGTSASARQLRDLAPARQRSRRLTRCACWRYKHSLLVLPTGGAWQRRSAWPGRWQPPCGLPCRTWLIVNRSSQVRCIGAVKDERERWGVVGYVGRRRRSVTGNGAQEDRQHAFFLFMYVCRN
jgi:hypothetical protein